MAFRFRLQKVLDHRQMVVDRKSRDVGEATRALAVVAARVKQNQADIRTALQDPGCPGGSLDLGLANRRLGWVKLLEGRGLELESQHAAARRELEKQRTLLTEAWRDLEVLRKLKERRHQEWQHEQLRRENQDLDEIGQIRADRRQREKLSSAAAQAATQGPPGGGQTPHPDA